MQPPFNINKKLKAKIKIEEKQTKYHVDMYKHRQNVICI